MGIKIPPPIKKRGQPKGHNLTAIGLPSKKRKGCKHPRPFAQLQSSEKIKGDIIYWNDCVQLHTFCVVILGWLVDKEDVESAMQGTLIDEDKIECIPGKVSDAVLDSNVDVNMIQKFCTSDAWLAVQHVIENKLKLNMWTCGVCQNSLLNMECESIVCESCLCWFHFDCVGIVRKPKTKNWFCRQCYAMK